ncbi:MAG: hypothetical protein WKH97_10120 [Casimicrobiaceae bacterium]
MQARTVVLHVRAELTASEWDAERVRYDSAEPGPVGSGLMLAHWVVPKLVAEVAFTE